MSGLFGARVQTGMELSRLRQRPRDDAEPAGYCRIMPPSIIRTWPVM